MDPNTKCQCACHLGEDGQRLPPSQDISADCCTSPNKALTRDEYEFMKRDLGLEQDAGEERYDSLRTADLLDVIRDRFQSDDNDGHDALSNLVRRLRKASFPGMEV